MLGALLLNSLAANCVSIYMQQTNSADNIFRCIFFVAGKGVTLENNFMKLHRQIASYFIFTRGKFFMLFSCLLNLFKIKFFEKFFQDYHRSVKQFGSRSGRTKHSVSPDLGPNCLQRLSAGSKSHC